MCPCRLMIPGITNLPARSTVSAPAGGFELRRGPDPGDAAIVDDHRGGGRGRPSRPIDQREILQYLDFAVEAAANSSPSGGKVAASLRQRTYWIVHGSRNDIIVASTSQSRSADRNPAGVEADFG